MRYIMPYLSVAMDASHCAYISETIRRQFELRILNGVSQGRGPAVVLGADGIGIEPQTYRPDRRNFICLGSFEVKKCPDIVFEAFRSLPPDELGGKLQFLGKVSGDLHPRLQQIVDYTGQDVEIVDGPSDEDIRTYLREARASIFISPNEGFGLPALETLYCGIPTVVSSALPSISGLPDHGQVRLPTVDAASVAAAMARLRDDTEARALWTAAADLDLPSWKDFAASLAKWVAET